MIGFGHLCCCVRGAVYSCALSEMDGSSCCFNLCCVSPCFARVYVRASYGLAGSPGWDLCIASCPCTALCSACQVGTYLPLAHPTTPPPYPTSF
jgi:hypothetical protein